LAGAIAAALALQLKTSHKWTGKSTALLAYAIEMALFIATWVIGIQYDDIVSNATSIDVPELVLIACLLGASMGIHNIAAKESVANCPSTTVMTMTMITVAQTGANSFV